MARTESYELVGPLAESTPRAFNLVVVVGVDGISIAGGLTTYQEVEAATNRAMIGRARRVIVVADGSKVGRLALARICGVDAVDRADHRRRRRRRRACRASRRPA